MCVCVCVYIYTYSYVYKVYYNFKIKKKCIQAELGEMDNWQEDANAWEEESDATWEAEEVLRWYDVLL